MFNNLKISTRLTLAFTIVVLITLIISTFSNMRMGLMNQNTNKIVVDLYPKTELARGIISNVNQISLSVRNSLLFVDNKMIESEIGHIRESQKKTDELIKKLESESEPGRGKELIANILASRQRFDLSLDKLIELSKRDGAAATNYMISEFRPANVAYMNSIDELIGYQGELMRQGGTASVESYTFSRNLLFALTVLAAILSAVLGFSIIRSIIRSLHRAVELASAVSQGDLTQRIEVKSRDETGQLLQALKD
ncbi:MAG: MCP four helix bundle domain-containing protein, partial [Gallionella sp.]